MTHALKCWPEYYKAIESGEKTFDLRKDDRPFKVGDTVICIEDSVHGSAFNVPLDEEFTISYLGNNTIKLEGYPMAYFSDRFQLVGQRSPLDKVLKKIKEMESRRVVYG